MAQRRILRDLRDRMADGRWACGSRLPTQNELAAEFGVTKVTINAAMRTLADSGFVAAGPQGSYVAARLPAEHTFGVVFPRCSEELKVNAFWTALHVAATATAYRPAGSTLRPYYVEEFRPLRESPDYARLQTDVELRCLRGLIFTAPPTMLEGTPVLEAEDLGYAGVFAPGRQWPQFSGLRLRTERFASKALDYLVLRHRRRVANLLVSTTTTLQTSQLAADMQARGMPFNEPWQQAMDINSRAVQWARNAVHLLFHAGQTERPDALIIWDDNLVAAATAGLVAAGVRVPDDVLVVAHCNYPVPTPAAVETVRLGYDACEVINVCLGQINRRLAHEDVADTMVDVDPFFEFERARNKATGGTSQGPASTSITAKGEA